MYNPRRIWQVLCRIFCQSFDFSSPPCVFHDNCRASIVYRRAHDDFGFAGLCQKKQSDFFYSLTVQVVDDIQVVSQRAFVVVQSSEPGNTTGLAPNSAPMFFLKNSLYSYCCFHANFGNGIDLARQLFNHIDTCGRWRWRWSIGFALLYCLKKL